MRFDDALALYEVLRKTVPGTRMNGILVKTVFIAPTDSDKLTAFLNYQIKEGKDAIFHFMNDEISVYGASEQVEVEGRVPRIELVLLDNLRFEMGN